jgi:hypothetical protein
MEWHLHMGGNDGIFIRVQSHPSCPKSTQAQLPKPNFPSPFLPNMSLEFAGTVASGHHSCLQCNAVAELTCPVAISRRQPTSLLFLPSSLAFRLSPARHKSSNFSDRLSIIRTCKSIASFVCQAISQCPCSTSQALTATTALEQHLL